MVLQQRQERLRSASIKDLKLAIPGHYLCMSSNNFFITLVIRINHLQNATCNKSALLCGTYEASLDESPPPKSLSLQFKQ